MSSGTNLDLILSTDYLSIQDEKLLKAKEEKEKITLGEGVSLAIEQEQILPSLLKSFSEPELEPNYDFRLDDETFDEITKDVNPEYWDEFSNASSLTKRELENNIKTIALNHNLEPISEQIFNVSFEYLNNHFKLKKEY